MQRGGGSKDTWVLADGPTPQFSLLQQSSAALEVSRATFDLPSRVADNLFWLGRYVERVEQAVRIVRAVMSRIHQESDPAKVAGLNAGLRVLSALGHIHGELPPPGNRATALENELLAMVYDSSARSSLGWTLPSTPPRGVAAARSHFYRRLAGPQPFRPNNSPPRRRSSRCG